MKTSIATTVDEGLRLWIDRCCTKEQHSRSQLVQLSLRAYLEQHDPGPPEEPVHPDQLQFGFCNNEYRCP